MKLTYEETVFIKHFLGNIGGLTMNNVIQSAIDNYKTLAESEKIDELVHILSNKYPLQYAHDIYLKAKKITEDI